MDIVYQSIKKSVHSAYFDRNFLAKVTSEQRDELRERLGLSLNSQSFETQIEKMYVLQAKQIRILTYFVLGCNVTFQVRTDAKTVEAQVMLILYWISTVFVLMLNLLSHRKNGIKLIRPAFLFILIRNQVRLYNFEGTDFHSSTIAIPQHVMVLGLTQAFILNMDDSAYSVYTIWGLCLLYSVSMVKQLGFLVIGAFLETLIMFFAIIFVASIISICYRVQTSIVRVLQNKIKDNYELQNQFKQILDNLQENILIFSEQKVEFVNEKFLETFYHLMIEKLPQIKKIQNKRKNCWTRLKNRLQSIFKKKSSIPDTIEHNAKIHDQKILIVFKGPMNDDHYEKECLSFRFIIDNFEKLNIGDWIFNLPSLNPLDDENQATQFFQISMKKYVRNNQEHTMLQFINISSIILYDMEKSQNQLLGMVNACVSHEMRNPLNSIVAQNIEKDYLYQELEQTIQEFVDNQDDLTEREFQDFENQNQREEKNHQLLMKCNDIILKLKNGLKVQNSSGNILSFIVQDLLDYAQIKSGKFRKNINEFCILEAVEEIMIIQQRKAKDNKIKLQVTFEGIDENNSKIRTDGQRVKQVLLCLQSNAIKFTKDGNVDIIVAVNRGYLEISVKDTGIGISKENQEKLFQLFGFLKDSQQMNTNGVGLGLVIAKQICEQFDGDISVSSELGVGSTFTYRFKLELIDKFGLNQYMSIKYNKVFAADSRELAFLWKPQVLTHQLEYMNNYDIDFESDSNLEKRILIVDDQSFNIEALKIILKYSVGLDSELFCDSSLSGHNALQIIKDDIELQKLQNSNPLRCKYNIIFMDLNMPDMGGNEACQLIRTYLYEQNIPQPIISAVTGHQEQMYIDQAIKSGMNQVLSKPMNLNILKELIEKLKFPVNTIQKKR